MESLKEYVLVQQSRREVEVFRRVSAHSPWTKSTHTDDQEVIFPSVGDSLNLSPIYEGLDLS